MAVQAVSPGTSLFRLIDRDDRSDDEVARLRGRGVRVLSRRHLESFLFDDEILIALCKERGHGDKIQEVIEAKKQALSESVMRGNPPDDLKSAGGQIYVAIKRILSLTQCGSTARAFMLETLVPLVNQETKVYSELGRDVFDM